MRLKIPSIWYIKLHSGLRPEVFMTEIVGFTDPVAHFEKFLLEIDSKLEGLTARNCLQQTNLASLEKYENILFSRFVLTLKNIGTESGQYKAKLMHNDIPTQKKHVFIH